MNTVLRILIESTIILSVFYLIYRVFFANDKDFKFSRIYLISSSLLAIIIPQLNIPILSSEQVAGFAPVLLHDAIQLPEVIISETGSGNIYSGIDISWTSILLIIYLTGLSVFLIKFLYETGTLLFFIYGNRNRIEKRSFYKIIYTGGQLPTSSFFHYLFWNEKLELNPREKEQILYHEEGHIRQLHSVDILYLELLKIIFWFNPLIHSYRKAISAVHEYLADEYVIQKDQGGQYIGLLARQVLQSCHISISNHFSKSQTVKRIRMMKANRRQPALLRWSISLSVLVSMFYIFSCETQNEIEKFDKAASKFPSIDGVKIIDPSGIEVTSFRKTVENWIEENPDHTYVVISSTRPQETIQSIYETGDWELPSFYIDKQGSEKSLYAVVNHVPGYKLQLEDHNRKPVPEQKNTGIPGEEIMKVVDQQPEPLGGMPALYEYVQENLTYPEEAKEQGIKGKVFIEFVVAKSGKVENVKVIRGLHPACDEEARRVINNSPNWKPGIHDGEPVNVRLILPITFALNNHGDK